MVIAIDFLFYFCTKMLENSIVIVLTMELAFSLYKEKLGIFFVFINTCLST